MPWALISAVISCEPQLLSKALPTRMGTQTRQAAPLSSLSADAGADTCTML